MTLEEAEVLLLGGKNPLVAHEGNGMRVRVDNHGSHLLGYL